MCEKYVGNQFVYIEPLKGQTYKEIQIKMLFTVLPQYISNQCKPYALRALCLSAFPLCDLTVNHPKPRMFCQDECRILEQYICAYEFSDFKTKFVPSPVIPCSKLPSVGSPEHKKCVSLNLTSK